MSVERSTPDVGSFAPRGAVFLSYASQDAEAAKKICDALRAAGVEVWFDQSELVGGDAWDQKIRKQIRECALFVPVLSQTTQSRREAYFRLEWKLADERTHLMARGTPFLLPVTIDATNDREALVPDSFLAVQWTKLPGGETPPAFCEQVKKLLGGAGGPSSREAGARAPTPASRELGPPALPKWLRPILASAAIAIAVLAVTLFNRREREAVAVPPPAVSAPVPAPAPVSEVRQLVTKARTLFEALDGTRDDYRLAEELVAQAKTKDATDAEVWAVESQLHQRFIQRGWDSSDARREAARAAAQRAIRLDAQSFEARFAVAVLLATTGREGEDKEHQLRDLRRERPTDQRVLRALASTLDRQGRLEEAFALEDESAALPGGDPLALYNKSLTCWFAGRTADADTAIHASLAQRPFAGALLVSAWYQTVLQGDLDGARETLNRIDPAQLQEDRAVFFAYYIELLARRPAAALARLAVMPRDWLNDNWYRGAKGLLAGDALQMDGRPDAAAVEWRAALRLADEQLAKNAKDVPALGMRVSLLAQLGARAEAARQFAVLLQLLDIDLAADKPVASWVTRNCVLLGRKAEAVRQIARGLKRERHAVDYTAATLRLDPVWDPLRGEPGFAEVIAQAEAVEQAQVKPRADTVAAPPADAKSVAVLAFANLSDDKANEYFSDGISEELLTVLQKIPGLHVAARTSAFSFKGKDATAQEIGAKLGVATLVEGSVRKAGSSVRITARLSRAATGEQLWSESYTRDLQDVFAVQSELAQTIVGQLRGQLGGSESKAEIQAQVQAAEKGGTRNAEAHQLYLQGKYLANRSNYDDAMKAIVLLQRAVELDPKFALAWATLSNAGWVRGAYGNNRRDFDEGYALARRAADRAIALEPSLPDGYLARLDILSSTDFDWQGSKATLRRAQELAPNDPAVIFRAAQLAYGFGREAEGIELIRQAVALDPVNAAVYVNQGYILVAAGRFAEAEKSFRQLLDIRSDSPWGHAGLAMVMVARGDFDQAATEVLQQPPGWSRLYVQSLALWGQKKRTEADAILAQLVKEYGDVAAYQIACAYAFRGEADRASSGWNGPTSRRIPA
ncbi:MAG: TIR domain-containing protein [Lacunisphaera sp.]